MNKSPWIKINKGDRRPTERVLVSYDYEDLLDGQKRWGVAVAWWNAKRQFWVSDRGKPISGVTHWMPLDAIG